MNRFVKLSARRIKSLKWQYPDNKDCTHEGKITRIYALRVPARKRLPSGATPPDFDKTYHECIGYRCENCKAYVYWRQ